MATPLPHPMHGANKLKLGVFSMNSDGGLTLTRVPERWPAIWSEIVEAAQHGRSRRLRIPAADRALEGFWRRDEQPRMVIRNADPRGGARPA